MSSVDQLLLCAECSDRPASRLLQAKMNILPHDTCRRIRGVSWISNTAHICVGSVPTGDYGVCKVTALFIAIVNVKKLIRLNIVLEAKS